MKAKAKISRRKKAYVLQVILACVFLFTVEMAGAGGTLQAAAQSLPQTSSVSPLEGSTPRDFMKASAKDAFDSNRTGYDDARVSMIRSAVGDMSQQGSDVLSVDQFPGIALPLSSLPYSDITNTTNATSDTGGIADPTSIFRGDCNSNKGVASVWYNYTPTVDISLLFDSIGSNYDTVIAIWTGTPGNLTLVACNDDISLFEIRSKVGLNAIANTPYFIEVIEYDSPSAQAEFERQLNLNISLMPADLTPPSVVSITRANLNPTQATSVNFDITFSEEVVGVGTGVGPSDFSLSTTGTLSGVNIVDISGSGTNYTVTVSTGSGAGTLRLDIPNTANITDFALNSLSGLPYTSGSAYSVRTQSFADVPLPYWAWQFIERLYAAGITGGCATPPLQYCPSNTVTRDQMAVFLLRAKRGAGYTPPPATGTRFADVPAGHWAAAWIEQLANEGITGGCGGSNYCPASPVNRDQMAVFLLRAKYGSGYSPSSPTGVFADVPTSFWAASWIERLAAEGITGGCAVGIYCPANPVTRDQMAIFLVRTFSLP